ncbi:MAG: hypothetical protein KKH88_04895 [Nanoarchaeota archaeon]|nr:hypothetical protein [Nanoarchaeota archaeon]
MQKPKRNEEIPVNDVLSMRQNGLDNISIAKSLQPTFQPEQISDAMNQADIKESMNSNEPGIPPGLRGAPSPTPREQMRSLNQSPTGDYNQSVPETVPSTASPIMYQSQGGSPSQSFAPMPQDRSNYNIIEEIAESIVKEKWEDLISGIGDIKLWKEKVDSDISSVKQEILRTQHRLENLQKAVIGKISEYRGSMEEVGSDIKALEKVFEKIIGPLTTNIKELDAITKKLKKK